MIDYRFDEQKRKNLILFIRTTQALIDEEGLENISIRKIASRSGFHNSTIYLYFRDLDELIMLASISHFQQYSKALEELSHRLEMNQADAYDCYFSISEYFGESAFKYPQIFMNFFFGKYSNDLFPFLNAYYDLFPDEKSEYSEDIEAMYYGENYTTRCMRILLPLLDDPRTKVTSENSGLINDIGVAYFRHLLYEKCCDASRDNTAQLKRFLSSLHFLIDKTPSAN